MKIADPVPDLGDIRRSVREMCWMAGKVDGRCGVKRLCQQMGLSVVMNANRSNILTNIQEVTVSK